MLRFSAPSSTVEGVAARRHPGEADDPTDADVRHGIEDEGGHAGALDHHIGPGHGICHGSRVIGRAQVVHEVGLDTRGHLVEHVDVETALDADERRQQTDGPGLAGPSACSPRSSASNGVSTSTCSTR